MLLLIDPHLKKELSHLQTLIMAFLGDFWEGDILSSE